METELNKAQDLSKYIRSYVLALKKRNQIYQREYDQTPENTSPSQERRIRDAKHTNGEHIEKLLHEIHCICVELGIAKYEEWRYKNSTTSAPLGSLNNGQHIHKRKPNS